MTAAEQLRALVKEATPGPWRAYARTWDEGRSGAWHWEGPNYFDHDLGVSEPDARLIALAPQLAELVADMGEALAKTTYRTEGYTGPDVWWKSEADALLARLDALFSEEDE